MESEREPKYILSAGAQVREEDFGLLFYTMAGPRLFFLSAGGLLASRFFEGDHTLSQWIAKYTEQRSLSKARLAELKEGLNRLKKKGVILER